MSEPSHLAAALRLAVRAIRSRGKEVEPAASVPRRRVAVERRDLRAEPRRLSAYLSLVGAEGVADGDLPPTYPALWETALVLDLLAGSGLPFPSGGIVHSDSEICIVRALRAEDSYRCRVELERVESRSRGLKLTVAARSWNPGGLLAREATIGLLLPGVRAKGFGGAGAPPGPTATPAGEWKELARWHLSSNQGRRYARVSGDYNPIHLWRWTARRLGYERPILQGFCTEALIAAAITRDLLRGDFSALRRLRTSFRAPVLLPGQVRLLVTDGQTPGSGFFRLVGSDDGGRTLAEGSYVGTAAAAAAQG